MAAREEKCIKVIRELFEKMYSEDEYSLNGPKDSAVCIEKVNTGWVVYECEKSSRRDLKEYNNVVEACLDMIKRMAYDEQIQKNTDDFLDAIMNISLAS